MSKTQVRGTNVSDLRSNIDRLTNLEQSVIQTKFIVDQSGVCQIIMGHLQYDNAGVATGLGDVWGMASFKTGSWVRL